MAKIKIKDLPESERPREKMMALGPDKLSDRELLAILIGSGTKEKSALDLADDILNKFGGLKGIEGQELSELTNIKGMKEAKALNIITSFEIATRILKKILNDSGIETE